MDIFLGTFIGERQLCELHDSATMELLTSRVASCARYYLQRLISALASLCTMLDMTKFDPLRTTDLSLVSTHDDDIMLTTFGESSVTDALLRVFVYGDIELYHTTLTKKEMMERKDSLPLGRCPSMSIADEEKTFEWSLVRYMGRVTHTLPSKARDALEVDQYMELNAELTRAVELFGSGQIPCSDVALTPEQSAQHERFLRDVAIPQALGYVEASLGDVEEDEDVVRFIAGMDALSTADAVWSTLFEKLDAMGLVADNKFELCRSHAKHVRRIMLEEDNAEEEEEDGEKEEADDETDGGASVGCCFDGKESCKKEQ